VTTVRSKDGTPIAYERSGSGPAILLVDGALCYRDSGPMRPLAKLLAPHYTVYAYDRRGRGESGDTPPYHADREVEDIEALIAEAGGTAFVYGISSGAALALEAANRLPGIPKLALYEAPFVVDADRPPVPDDYVEQQRKLIAAGRRGDAVKMFMKTVGVPAIFIAMMRVFPAWSKLTGVAHTIAYDISILKGNQRGKPLPANRWTNVTMPALVAVGGKSDAWMKSGMRNLADVLPNPTRRILDGQNHMVSPKALAPVLIQFFAG
jgi:pimeloyl-ACP methyl ester carboxylesterase